MVAQTFKREEIMRFGIPLLVHRVAPRCTFADTILLVTARHRRIQDQVSVPLEGTTWADLAAVLGEHAVETLVCGGISPSTRESIRSRDVAVIDNVTGTEEEILEALRTGRIRPGFGFGGDEALSEGNGAGDRRISGRWAGTEAMEMDEESGQAPEDCLACRNRVCLEGAPCPYLDVPPPVQPSPEVRGILESAWDVALEEERALCRVAELVYFALEAGYRRLGLAFCEDLREPASILTGVLRRFFEVVPAGCRLGGDGSAAACDPSRVAAFLNSKSTDLNVLVGFCVGADCVFNRESQAPVTTVFVKDKSLANNPIGAVYSHYYLEDI
jgi:uncharacterized metal-binding protein